MENQKPSTQFAYRTNKKVDLVKATPLPLVKASGFKAFEGETSTLVYDKAGSRFAYSTSDSIYVIDAETQQTIIKLEHPDVLAIALSPLGTYISTWQRATKDDAGATIPNTKLYEVKSGKLVNSFIQKTFESWELQWTSNESFMARKVTNEVHFYDKNKLEASQPAFKLRLEGLSDFSLSPGKSPHVAVFVPEKKGGPAYVRMYSIPNFSSPVASKSFFKADRVTMAWNDLGTNILVHTQTDVDKTGKSYYGESNLYFLSVAGNFDCRVPLDKEGPVHDFAWAPTSKEFAVCYGFMPSKAVIYDHRVNVVSSFGEVTRNYVRFSPHGRYFLLGGFGNLNGAVDVYDNVNKKKICTIDASGSAFCEWLPDGRHFVTAILSPRLRVDNGFKVWHYTGALVHEESHNILFQVALRPQLPELFPFKSKGRETPPPKSITTAKPAQSKPAGAYVPPHLRRLEEAKAKAENGKPKKEAKPADDAEQLTKKLRNMQKKLKQIDELIASATNGKELKREQIAKIKTKTDLVLEIENLTNKLRSASI